MKLNKKTLSSKKFRALTKRRDEISWEIYRAKRKWKPLKEPYQDGWILYIGLREDAMRREDAPLMLEALSKIQCNTWTKDPKLVSKIRANPGLSRARMLFPKRSGGWPFYNDIYNGCPSVAYLTKEKHQALPERLKSMFYVSVHTEPARWGMQERKVERYYFFIPDYYLIVKVKKRMITHVGEIDPALMKEKAEIEAQLEDYWYREPGRSERYGEDQINQPNVIRSHWRAALTKLKKNELDDVYDYSSNKNLR